MNNEKLKEMTVAELKDLIKNEARKEIVELPAGMWKMTKVQLIDFIKENIMEETETEEVVEKIEEVISEESEVETNDKANDKDVEHVSYDKENKRGGGSKKKVKMTSEDEVLIFDKIDDAHKWLKENHDLGYYHIKKGLEGVQTRKLVSINIKFEKVED